MEPLKYLDFELLFERRGGRFLARVLRSPAGEASSTFTLPGVQPTELEAATGLGTGLFEAVFSGEVLACFKSSLDRASQQPNTGLRLKLRLQEAPELANLPWEFLCDPSLGRFLARSDYTPIVRYIEMPESIQPLTVALPLRILVMISNPANYASLDVVREKSKIENALDPLVRRGKVELEWLEEATLNALQRRLRDRDYHILHYIGHGGFDEKTKEGVLVLTDDQGTGWWAGGERIGTLLHDCRSVRLAVLNACEGARNARTDPFASVASKLVRQGVPAVVAMQFEISDKAAITFSGEFYAALADGFPVDAALAEARKAIYGLPNDVEWGTPVLYMRSPDGVLFVTGKAEQGASLKVTPQEVSFGKVHPSDERMCEIKVENKGSGELNWEFSKNGDFFRVDRHKEKLVLTLGASPGTYQGSVSITSNGGTATVQVHAVVEAEPEEQDLSGEWIIPGTGVLRFFGGGSQYSYQEFNPFGIMVSQGTAVRQGNVLFIQGFNFMGGPLTARLGITGNTMQGQVTMAGMVSPLTLMRSGTYGPATNIR